MTDNILKCIKNGKIILEDEVLDGKVLVFDHKITDIIDETRFEAAYSGRRINTIDAGGRFVSPGFIDVHIHGFAGRDTMDGQLSDLEAIGESIAKNGVTGFLPTTMSMGKDEIQKALDAVRRAMGEKAAGAQVLGAHMEGPFISKDKKGAQNGSYIIRPDPDLIRDYPDVVRIITMAPEVDPQLEFIKSVRNNSDIVLSLGHTDSDYETAMDAIRAGMSHAAHLFNAMSAFHHRAPGVIGAVLKSTVTFELIADTLHVHPALFQILINAKGKNKMILVTDAMRAGGMGDGVFNLGGQEVRVKGRAARLEDGTLAGSTLAMNEAVYNILQHTDLELYEAVALASANPAKLLNVFQAKGSIGIGKDADLTVFDETLQIDMTVAGGNIVYSAAREP